MTPILKTLGWMVIGRKWWSILFVKNNSYVLHVAQYFSLFLPIGPHRNRTYSAWMKLITTQTCAICFCYFHLKLHSAISLYYTSSFYSLAASLYILCCKPNHPLIVWVAPYCSTMYILVAILSATPFHGISMEVAIVENRTRVILSTLQVLPLLKLWRTLNSHSVSCHASLRPE